MSEVRRIIMGWDVIEEPAEEAVQPEDVLGDLSGIVVDAQLLKVLIRSARKRAEMETGLAIGEQTVRMTLNRFPLKSDEDGLVFPLLYWPVIRVLKFEYLEAGKIGRKVAVKDADWHLDLSTRPARCEPLPDAEYWPLTRNSTDAVTLEYRAGRPASDAMRRAIAMTAAHLMRNKDDVPGKDQPFPVPLAASAIFQSE